MFFWFSVAGQESIELLSLCETNDEVLQSSSSQDDISLAVSVSYGDLNGVSNSILLAESWLRSNVLAHYPAVRISSIVVKSDFCQQGQEQKFHLVLPSLKNVYHSLKRWGLEKDIKVSVAFPLDCLLLHPTSFDDHFKMANLKHMIEYLQSVNSTYSLIPHSGLSHFSHESFSLVSSHLESMKNLGFSYLKKVNVLAILPKARKHKSRKLSVVDSSLIDPFPLRPTPLSEIAEPPMHPFVGYPPHHAPLGSPSPMAPPTLAPEPPRVVVPASSPHGFTLPPCNPIEHGSHKSWCVAKPSVPAVKLQQAMEYACGEGGADCEDITPMGKCYNPDNVVAHASYAFNSYWQKHKRTGGTCSFGGTAMLIYSDPSKPALSIILLLKDIIKSEFLSRIHVY